MKDLKNILNYRQYLNLLFTLLVILFFPIISLADFIRIPDDYETIQEGIDAATEGDTVLIARGTYIHDSLLVNKRLVITSNYIEYKDKADIDSTTIKASSMAGKEWFLINSDATGSKIIGLKIEGNSEHSLGITNTYTEVIHCKFIGGKDQLSLEGSSSILAGGYIGYCYFEGAGDDGIDCDNTGNWIIEHNTIISSDEDGIEVRLQPKLGPLTSHIFRYNTIINSGQSGIQLINYPEDSFRAFQIYGNIFKDCNGSGISCMYNTETTENYQGSAMEEKATIYNNTFDNCNYGLTESPNLIILNNIIANCKNKGIARGAYVKIENDNSIVDYCDFYNNHTDYDSDISIGLNIFNFDPKFENTTTYNLLSNSEAIDAGTADYSWQDLTVLSIPDSEYVGAAPDFGAKEYNGTHIGFENNNIIPLKVKLYPNYPNPFNPTTVISWQLAVGSQVDLSIYNMLGQKLETLFNKYLPAGYHEVEFNGQNLSSGVYLYRIQAGEWQDVKKMVLIR